MSDCIIVGAGLIGMLTASELASAGVRVTLVEKTRPARESSWAGGGILSPLYPWRYNQPVNALAQLSQQRYPAFCRQLFADTGIDPQCEPSGLLITDIDDESAVERWREQFGISLEWLSADQARQTEPQLGIEPLRSAWLPDVAQVRNPRLVQSLLARVEQQGVEVRSDCPVLEWQTAGDRVSAVVTPQGELVADHYVVASGAWSGGLLKAAGIDLPIQPVRGQMILFQGPPGLLSRITLHQGRYAIPRRDGHVLFGSTLEYTGFVKQTTDAAREELTRAAFELIPALADLPLVKHWAGLRPGSPEGTPVIGPHPELTNLFVNTGHFRNGVVLGLASAQLLADLLLQRPTALDNTPYLPEIFIKNNKI
jgi:glycine oxidase